LTDLAIEARGLRKEFGGKIAVRDLSLSVPRGEVFGFLGPNGAGKTTSMKMLLGLVHPSEGSGRLLGEPLGARAGRARVGYLPEHFAFHDFLPALELLTFHARLVGVPSSGLGAHVAERLARVGLGDAGRRSLREYSKGMKQRFGLAQALLGAPELVFLDEPTSGLDPLGRRLVRDVIRELRGQGTTVFLNSHLLSEIEVTCDRVVFVKGGRVVRETVLGAVEAELEVELRLEGVITSEILTGLDRFGRGARLDGAVVRLGVASEDRLPEMTRWLASRGVGLYHLAARRRSLEELFLEVIGDVSVVG
jgi:ABC-2 type transport system ATP-binding protein